MIRKEQNKGTYLNNKHLNEEAIALCIDALVLDNEAALPAVIRSHIEECQECRREIFTGYDIAKQNINIKTVSEDRPNFELKTETGKKHEKNMLYQVLRIAAVFLILIGISSLAYYLVTPDEKVVITQNEDQGTSVKNDKAHIDNTIPGDKKVQVIDKSNKKSDRTNTSAKKNVLAENMRESELFETLITSGYRSNGLTVLSPSQQEQFSLNQAIIFHFRGEISEALIIKIYNNREEKQFEKDNISTNNYTLETKLSSGLYYWKLEREDDLLYIGKFIVK